jgi:hypothetical protein
MRRIIMHHINYFIIFKKNVNKKTISDTQMIRKKNSKFFKLIMLETYLSYYYFRINAKIIWNPHLKSQEDSTIYAYYYK